MEDGGTDVLADLHEWISGRPTWQLHAVVRLMRGDVSADDIRELADLAIDEVINGRQHPEDLLSSDQLVLPANDEQPVRLSSISDVRDVNRLATGQTLEFADSGITVVYGTNGAGKSGYARILRQVCRVRGTVGQVLPDVFASGTERSPSATIALKRGNNVESTTWTGSPDGSTSLNRVWFFDARASLAHLNDDADAAFTPAPVALLARLAETCKAVADNITTRGLQIRAARWQPPEFDSTRAVGKLLAGSLAAAGIEDEINRLSELSEEELGRLVAVEKELASMQASDPAAAAEDLRGQSALAAKARAALAILDNTVGAAGMAAATREATEVRTAREAAEAAGRLLQGMTLTGIGSATWLQLWEAARRYSQSEAYPDHRFPHTDDPAVCLLCQRPIDQPTRERFLTLEQFVQQDAQTALDQRIKVSDTRLANVRRTMDDQLARLDFVPNGVAWNAIRETATSVRAAADARFELFRGMVDGDTAAGDPAAAWPVPALIAELDRTIAETDAEVKRLSDIAKPEYRLSLEREQADLTDRKRLSEVRDDLLAQVSRERQSEVLRGAWKRCGTQAISLRLTLLSQQLVTDHLRSTFQSELAALGADRLQVESRPKGTVKGRTLFQLSFVGLNDRNKMSEVLSEGECRAVALARFLTDVVTMGGSSGIVLDDPVSSLDHKFRNRVAERIAAAGGSRQVIVFTHDLAFVEAIQYQAHKIDVSVKCVEVQRSSIGAGVCADGIRDLGASLKDRVGMIANAIQNNKKYFENDDEYEWAKIASQLSGQLRAAWERAVEESLLNEAVTRFDRPVQTNRLRVVSVEDADWDVVRDAMTELSRWTDAHDEPLRAADVAPTPAELTANLENLKKWTSGFEARRKDLRKRRRE